MSPVDSGMSQVWDRETNIVNEINNATIISVFMDSIEIKSFIE